MKSLVLIALAIVLFMPSCKNPSAEPAGSSNIYNISEGYVDANGVMIFYKTFGKGEPLMILHGGPGASHDYFLPYLIPLARTNRLIFIDERGSGKSEKLDDAKEYTVDNMVEDAEAVRKELGLGKMNLLGHSCGGVIAQAYALKYQANLSHLVLCSTFASSSRMNAVFDTIKAAMSAGLRDRIASMEKDGLFGNGAGYEKNRYPAGYMTAAWGEGYFPYLYQRRPDPNYDPVGNGVMSWDLYREMWGSDGEFVISGNLRTVEFDDQLSRLRVPTLITVGDHDECAPSLSKMMHNEIAGSKLVIFPQSGHMTFVDQPALFVREVGAFLKGAE
jgi:proline iminopeptidase